MDNGLGNLPKAVQEMVVVRGKVGGQLMKIALWNALGDLENLLPDRRMCLHFTPARRRASPRTDRFVRLFPVRFHVAIIMSILDQVGARRAVPLHNPFCSN